LEDEQSISRLMRVTLTRAGHEVVETADGRDTILKYREAMAFGRRFDLLVSDLTIEGGVGGVETIRALRRIDPDVVAIVSSGYSDAAAMAEPEQFGFCDVLPKPYAPRELVEIVNRALGKTRPASGNQDLAESSI
jgi:DNA-binding NtrC family response regulator